MKSNVTNTFSEGLVLDLNENVTPNKVMTDALNATLITYNGNEFSLQNDMGNAKVGTSYLPKGYIPVGMAEHGGIIYVASFNPDTKKGQIGCFPSPQQLYSSASEDGTFTEISIDLNNLLSIQADNEGNPKYILVNQDFYRQDLFTEKETNNPKEFHPGDRFIIKANLSNLSKFLKEGPLEFKLASVGKDGIINYINDKDLRTYTNSRFWIYDTSDPKEKEVMQVFPGKTSGKLIFIIEYNIFDSFDLSWIYNIEEEKVTSATFTGKAFKNGTSFTELYDINSNNIDKQITIDPSENLIDYKIAPYSKYGISNRLIKSGTIDLNELLDSKEGTLNSWAYFVGDDYIDLEWGFSYFDINNQNLESIKFTFIPLSNINIYNGEITEKGCKEVTVSKEAYNGIFTEHIPFTDNFRKNSIYVCKIEKVLNGSASEVAYEYVYTSGYFNGISANKIKEYKINRPEVKVTPECTIDFKISDIAESWKTFDNKKKSWKEFTGNSKLTVFNPETDADYNFTSYVKRTYTVDPSIQLKAGVQESNVLTDLLKIDQTNASVSLGQIDSIKEYNIQDSDLESKLKAIPEGDSLSQIENSSTTYKIDLIKGITASQGIAVKKYELCERLRPVYDVEGDNTEQFGAKYTGDNNLLCMGMNALHINTNVMITGSPKTEEDSVLGTNIVSDVYIDDSHFQSGIKLQSNSAVNITAGIISNYAKLKYFKIGGEGKKVALERNSNEKINGLLSTVGEEGVLVDGDVAQNYLIASWNTYNGIPYLINLATAKNPARVTRLDNLLRCIMSQLLVVKRHNELIHYIAPSQFLMYELPTSYTINSTVTGNTVKDDYEEYYSKWNKFKGVINYLPKLVTTEFDEEIQVKSTFGEDFHMPEEVINVYAMSNEIDSLTISPQVNNDKSWRQKIYIGNVSDINDFGICQLETDTQGQYTVNNSFEGLNYDKLKFKDGQELFEVQSCKINDRFISRYGYETQLTSGEAPLENSYKNTVYIRTPYAENENSGRAFGEWEGPNPNPQAPDMAYRIHFGDISPYLD